MGSIKFDVGSWLERNLFKQSFFDCCNLHINKEEKYSLVKVADNFRGPKTLLII